MNTKMKSTLADTLIVCELMASANLLAVVGMPDDKAYRLTAELKAYNDGAHIFKGNLDLPAYLFAYPSLVFNFQEGYTSHLGGTYEAEIDAHCAGYNHARGQEDVPTFLKQCPELFPEAVKLFQDSYKSFMDTPYCSDCEGGFECALH